MLENNLDLTLEEIEKTIYDGLKEAIPELNEYKQIIADLTFGLTGKSEQSPYYEFFSHSFKPEIDRVLDSGYSGYPKLLFQEIGRENSK